MADTLIEDYRASLKELTLNSRPIIDTLLTIAKENSSLAPEISSVVIDRIYSSRPEYKLFALYLLDSICKIVGLPYTQIIAPQLYSIFSHIFQLSNESTRSSLIKVFETWKVTKLRGSSQPLFDSTDLDQISSFLKKAGYPKINLISIDQRLLISNIDQLIPIFKSKLNLPLPDPKLNDRLNALHKLKNLLSSQKLKQNELSAIQSQLNNIKENSRNSEQNGSDLRSTNGSLETNGFDLKTLSTNGDSKILSNLNQIASYTSPVDTIKVQSIFKDLILSGIVKLDQKPIPGSKPNYEIQFPKIKYIQTTITQNSNDLNQYRSIPRNDYDNLKFNQLIIISKSKSNLNDSFQNFIKNNKLDSSTLDLLYLAKSFKCSICGKRFSTDLNGNNNKTIHLDWHFRINKKLNSNSNIQSRNWYLDDFDWAHFKDESLLEFATIDEKTDIKNDEEILNNAPVPFVIVPSNDTNTLNRCIFCREVIQAEYNDDNGEWCWLNCVRSPGESNQSRRIMHVHCFNEAKKKRGIDDALDGADKRVK